MRGFPGSGGSGPSSGTGSTGGPTTGGAPPKGRSVVAEVYPSLWSSDFPRRGRTPDEHDAYAVAARLSRAQTSGELEAFFTAPEDPAARELARIEGWILGVRAADVGLP